MCCTKSAVMGTREIGGAVGLYRASGGYMTIGRDLANTPRWGVIRDAEGQIMADIRATSVTSKDPPPARRLL